MNQNLPSSKAAAFFRFISLCSFLLASFTGASQVISTFAGTGFNGETGSGGPAIQAGLPYPQGICLDADGNLYVTGFNKVRKVNASTGIITTVAGTGTWDYSGDGGPATSATLKFAIDVFVDGAGHLYIAEYGGHRVRKVDSRTGVITTIAGTGTPGFSGDGGLAINAQINTPQSICVDNNGNVYIADYHNSRIRKVDGSTGIITTIAGNGSAYHSGDGGLAINAAIPYVNSVALDPQGNLYLVEVNNSNTCRVRKINKTTGIITTVAGFGSYAHSGDGGLAVNASLFDPTDVCIDAAGNIYIAQYDDSRIRKIDAQTGIITTVAGAGVNGFSGDCGLATNARIYYPTAIDIDAAGNLYIADNTNHRVRKVFTHAKGKSTTSLTLCASQLPYSWNGLSINSAGTYVANVRPYTVPNCDSVATLLLTVNPLITKDTALEICANDLPVTWRGLSITAAGTYSKTIGASTGCDTVIRLMVTVNNLALTVNTTPTLCNQQTGSAMVNANGKAPYTYLWNTTPAHTGAQLMQLGAGTYTVQVVDSNGCRRTASATVTADATGQAPLVQCPKDTTWCINSSGSYKLQAAIASSACGLKSLRYQVSGATTRMGTDGDASGVFGVGLSTITWTAVDIYNNTTICQMKVTVIDPFTLTVPDTVVLTKGVMPNTVYLGYSPATVLRLEATVTGSPSAVTYKWSNGSTEPYINVSPVRPTTYTVEVMNAMGCTKEVSKTVQVMDIRCGVNGDKVQLCQVPPGNKNNESKICMDGNAVAAHLEMGSYLGLCKVEVSDITVRMFSNPSSSAFTLTIQSPSSEPALLNVYDQYGKLVEQRQKVATGSVISIGATLQPGLYLLEVIQGDQKTSTKLVKQ